jgi:hypothetical protein
MPHYKTATSLKMWDIIAAVKVGYKNSNNFRVLVDVIM